MAANQHTPINAADTLRAQAPARPGGEARQRSGSASSAVSATSSASEAVRQSGQRKFPPFEQELGVPKGATLNFTTALSSLMQWKVAVSEAYGRIEKSQNGTKEEQEFAWTDLRILLQNDLANELKCLTDYGVRLRDYGIEASNAAAEDSEIAEVQREVGVKIMKLSSDEIRDKLLQSRGKMLELEDIAKLNAAFPQSRSIKDIKQYVKDEMELYERSERTSLLAVCRLGHVLTLAKEQFEKLKIKIKENKKIPMKYELWLTTRLKISLSKSHISKVLTVYKICSMNERLCNCSVGMKFIYQYRKEIKQLLVDKSFLDRLAK